MTIRLLLLRCACALLGLGLFPGASAATTEAHNGVSGEAYGVFVNVTAGTARVTVGKTPRVTLPAGGGMDEEQIASVSVPGTLSADTLTVMTEGAVGATDASAQSSATVEAVNILDGLVTAQLVVAMSSSTGNGTSATSNADGSTLIGLAINGVPMGDVTPAPNTTVAIPGVGTVILNEQVASGDGARTTALTVNMIHVVLDGALTGDIVVAAAHSDVNFAPAPTPPTGFMTGGGRLGTGRQIATFGFNAGPDGDGAQGQLQYVDHARDLVVHATSVDSYSRLGATCVAFSGRARVNGADGFSFRVTEACDNAEPGVGHDSFAISVSGPGLSYSRSGVLTGGNLQLH